MSKRLDYSQANLRSSTWGGGFQTFAKPKTPLQAASQAYAICKRDLDLAEAKAQRLKKKTIAYRDALHWLAIKRARVRQAGERLASLRNKPSA